MKDYFNTSWNRWPPIARIVLQNIIPSEHEMRKREGRTWGSSRVKSRWSSDLLHRYFRNSLKWTMNSSFVLFRFAWPQKWVLMLGVKCGRAVWSELVVGITKFSPTKQTVRERPLLSKVRSYGRARRTGESAHWCLVDANLSVLNFVTLKNKKDSPGLYN